MKYTVFSIDREYLDNEVLALLEYFKEHAEGGIIRAVGCYKGCTENSFICLSSDFDRIIKDSVFYKNQESCMRVSECNKQYAHLEYRDGRIESLGCLKDVSREEAMKHDAWTYRPDEDVYWISVHENPDHLPAPKKMKKVAIVSNRLSFSEAFALAKRKNADEFIWQGKQYNTLYATERGPEPAILEWKYEEA